MKRFFNFLKLYFAICTLLATVSMWVDTSRRFHKMENDEWLALGLVTLLFWLTAFFLIRWYVKTRQKFDKKPIDPNYSRFYLKFQKYLDQFSNKTFNGFGSKYMLYTNRDEEEKTIDATQWLVVGFFPIVPLYRDRLIIHSSKDRNFGLIQIEKSEIEIVRKQLMNRKLNKYVYIFYYAFFYPMILLPIVIFLANLDFFNKHFPGTHLWFLLIGYILWGILMYAFSEFFNKRMFLYRFF